MKNNLFEAIGFVEEDLLCEAEKTPTRQVHSLRRIALVAAIIVTLALTAMASVAVLKGLLPTGENGASMENLSSSTGSFIYHEGAVYYGDFGRIYRCDLEGNILQTYPLSNPQERPCYMFASEDAILYTADVASTELTVQPKGGSASYTVELSVGVTNAYADGQFLYTTDGGTMLSRIDLVTLEKTELLENVSSYFVDDTYIYAVQSKNKPAFYRSAKDEIRFEPISLGFIPNKVIAHGEALYLCEQMDYAEQAQTGHTYRVNLVHEGKATALPVYSWLYQVSDGCILYLEYGTTTLKCYDLTTGETELIAENVFAFSVLDERYICIERYNQTSLIHDLLTEQIHPIATK